MAAAKKPDYPIVAFKTPKAFDTWLSKNHDSAPGIWIQFAKKASGLKSVTYHEALDIALCHGWIDGLRKKFDEDTFVQKFTPRGPKSIWSKINKAKALALIDAKRMHAGGHAAIEMAKANGRWDSAYDGYKASTIPPDLEAAFKKNPKAKKFFASVSAQNRYAVLFRIQTANKPELRQRRIDQFIAMLNEGKTIY
ncbi:MAG TPA: YdeI/OmpD-associated family protein [Gemmatimonadaceae bacterium]|nr:YdeI/OmpD-associated family protein [Gemmatimonadaceae bacterium]